MLSSKECDLQVLSGKTKTRPDSNTGGRVRGRLANNGQRRKVTLAGAVWIICHDRGHGCGQSAVTAPRSWARPGSSTVRAARAWRGLIEHVISRTSRAQLFKHLATPSCDEAHDRVGRPRSLARAREMSCWRWQGGGGARCGHRSLEPCSALETLLTRWLDAGTSRVWLARSGSIT